MTSDLKWRTGFGWGSVFLLLLAISGSVLAVGVLRLASIGVAVLVCSLIVLQYRKWNSRGWPSLHWRAMLLYSAIAGLETAKATGEGRGFDRVAACRDLALKMCGPGKELNIEVMLTCLKEEEGFYLASLLADYRNELLPGASDEAVKAVLEAAQNVKFGPQLVICNVIENSLGRAEAARYALALMERKAT